MPEVTAATDAISAAVILQRGALLRDTLARDDAVLAHSFRVIVNELGELLRIIAEYNKLVSLQVSFLDEEDQPTSDAVKEWREQARGLDEESQRVPRYACPLSDICYPYPKRARPNEPDYCPSVWRLG